MLYLISFSQVAVHLHAQKGIEFSCFRYKKIARTFWIRGNVSDTFEQRVSVILSTPSAKNISFSIKLDEVPDFATSPKLMRNPDEAHNFTDLVEGVLDQGGWRRRIKSDFNSS